MLSRHEFEQTRGESEGQGIPACCNPQGHRESDTIKQLLCSTKMLNNRYPKRRVAGWLHKWRVKGCLNQCLNTEVIFKELVLTLFLCLRLFSGQIYNFQQSILDSDEQMTQLQSPLMQ